MLDPLGNPTYYAYDAAGRQTAEIDAQGHEETVHYNDAGQVIQRDKASGVGAYYIYDGMHVSREVRYPSGDMIYYYHDRADATSLVLKTGVPQEAFDYDAAGRVVRSAVTSYGTPPAGVAVSGLPMGLNSPGFGASGATRYQMYYTYDGAGSRTQMGFLGGGVAYFTYYAYAQPAGEPDRPVWADGVLPAR